jgi:hypothetical protein
MGAVAAGEVSVRDIGTCEVTVQADSTMAADRRSMARQFYFPRSTSKFIPPCSSVCEPIARLYRWAWRLARAKP